MGLINELNDIAIKYDVYLYGNSKTAETCEAFAVGSKHEIAKKDCSNCITPWEENHSCPNALKLSVASGIQMEDKSII